MNLSIPIKWGLSLPFVLLILLFSGCEKELEEKTKIYEDDFQDTSGIAFQIDSLWAGTDEQNDVTIEHGNGLIEFHSAGFGRAIGKIQLSEQIPDIEDHPKIALRLHFQKFSGSTSRGNGPILRLDIGSEELRFAPYNGAIRRSREDRDLQGSSSFTFHIDRRVDGVEVTRDGGKEVTEFFRKGDGDEVGDFELWIGASSGYEQQFRNPPWVDVYLDRLEVYTP